MKKRKTSAKKPLKGKKNKLKKSVRGGFGPLLDIGDSNETLRDIFGPGKRKKKEKEINLFPKGGRD